MPQLLFDELRLLVVDVMRASFQPTFSFVISRFPPPHVFVLTPLHSRAPAQRATFGCVCVRSAARSAERPGRHHRRVGSSCNHVQSRVSQGRGARAPLQRPREGRRLQVHHTGACVRGGTSGPGERTWQLSVASAASSLAGLRGARQPAATLARHCSSHHSGACRHHTTKTPPAACGLARQQYGPHVSRLPSGRSPRTPRLSRTDEGRGDHPHQPRDAGGEGLRLRLQLLVTRRIQPA